MRKPKVGRASSRAIVTAVVTMILSGLAGADAPRVEIIAADGSALATVQVEIADTEGKREFGLMYRRHLEEDAGMIFVFDHPQRLTFWMKHTEIPLDMIFADANGRIIGIVANAVPFSERQLSVAGDSQYVLEVNGGFCKRHRIESGVRLKFAGFTPRAKDTG
jgi:uncharacterized membrane protein (UPF0127 family)